MASGRHHRIHRYQKQLQKLLDTDLLDKNYALDNDNSRDYQSQQLQFVYDDIVASLGNDNYDPAPIIDAGGHINAHQYQPHPPLYIQPYTELIMLPAEGGAMDNSTISTTTVAEMIFRVSTTLIPNLTQNTTPIPSSASSSASRVKNIKIISYCYILPLVCVLGIIGNLMNVMTLASSRLRAVSYMYLRALAIADLLCMCFVLFFASCELLKESIGLPIDRHPLFGFYQAHLMLSFINWTLSTGVLIVVALSLERYVSVVFPLHFRVWNSPKRASKAIMAAYLVPALFYIPYGIARYTVKESVNNGIVIYVPDDSALSKTLGWQIYKWTREALLRFLPIVILFVLNSQIMIVFRRRQRLFSRLRNREQDDTLLYILGGIAVMFFVCNIPAAINLLFINETVKKRLDYQIFRAVANLLEITNHAAQFYIFCVCSSDYRITFMQKFPCLRAHYINRTKFYSFLRSKRSAAIERSGAPGDDAGARSTTDGGGGGTYGPVRVSRKANSEKRKWEEGKVSKGNMTREGAEDGMRSTTVTAELLSNYGGAGNGKSTVAEQDTMDSRVQLASEESLSDESEELLLISSAGHWPGKDHQQLDESAKRAVGRGINNNNDKAGKIGNCADPSDTDESGTCFL